MPPDTQPQSTEGVGRQDRYRSIRWALDGGWIDPNKARDAWHSQFSHRLGRFGYPFHVALAVAACFTAAGPHAFVEIGPLPLLVCWFLRWPFVWRGFWEVLKQPAAFVSVAWLGWLVLSISWSGDAAAGWHEASFSRWMWLGLALWPVLDRRRWMIAALCAGLAVAHGAQVFEFVALRQGFVPFSHPESPDPLARISGWWQQPAIGGVMCTVALGLHIGPAVWGKGWRRWAGAAGSIAACMGLVMTGTRGAMVAAVMLLGVVALVSVMRFAHAGDRRTAWRRVIIVMGVVFLLAGLGWAVAGKKIGVRVDQARAEIARVLDKGDVDSDIGGRVVAARAAGDAFGRAPLHGGGAGSFRQSVDVTVRERGLHIEQWRADKLRTAHSTPLHAMATTGLVGLVLLAGAYACGLWGAVGARIGTIEQRETLGTYGAAPLLGLAALVLCGLFETIYLNMNTQALMCLLIGLSMPVRPCPR